MNDEKKRLNRRIKINVKKALAFHNAKLGIDEKQMTFKMLCEKVGVVPSTMYNYVNAVKSPDIETLKKVSEVTGCPLCEFVPIKFD